MIRCAAQLAVQILPLHPNDVQAEDAKHDDGPRCTEINMPGCMEALQMLRAQGSFCFAKFGCAACRTCDWCVHIVGHSLFLVSYCGRARAQDTNDYLLPLGLFDGGLFFTPKRSLKADVCRMLGLDVLIDDRVDNLMSIVAPTQTLHFNSGLSRVREREHTRAFRPTATASTWEEALGAIRQVIQTCRLEPDLSVDAGRVCHEFGRSRKQGARGLPSHRLRRQKACATAAPLAADRAEKKKAVRDHGERKQLQ